MVRSPGVSVAGSISWGTRSGVAGVRVVFMPPPVLPDTTRARAGPSASGYAYAARHLLGQSLGRPGTPEARIVRTDSLDDVMGPRWRGASPEGGLAGGIFPRP